MKNKKTVMIILLVFALILGGASVLYNRLGRDMAPEQLAEQAQASKPASDDSDSSEESEPEKVLAPDFTVYDLERNEVHLSDFIGKPVILNFWASWCGPCQSEMPEFNEEYLALSDDVAFLMVNLTDGTRETVEGASAFIARKGYAFPVLYDTSGEAASAYGVYSIPVTYFIDAQGHAVAQATGAIGASTLRRGLEMILP